MSKNTAEPVEIANLDEDFEKCSNYIDAFLKKEKVSDTVYNETMLVFEAIYHNIMEQNNDRSPVMLRVKKEWGDAGILISYEGDMYRPGVRSGSDLSAEEKILKAYNDRIDYSFVSGYNRIQITIRHSREKTVIPCVIGAAAAIALYTAVHFLTGPLEEQMLLNDWVFPAEKLCGNLVLMVGAPMTFISFLKNLTDTFIIGDRQPETKKIRKEIIFSSLFAVLLGIITSLIVMQIIEDPEFAYINPSNVNMSVQEILETLIPADVFTPFMIMSPFPLLILALLVTFSLCSIGKYFDSVKRIIEISYALFSRMLTIVMYGLPFFVFLAVFDVILSDGYGILLYYIELILIVMFGLMFILFLYWLRLFTKGIPAGPLFRKLGPLIKENYRIGAAIDAAPYNIRYCARTWSMDRKKLEANIPVLAEINLDGNCFLLTLMPVLFMFVGDVEVTAANIILVGILAFFLSLGAPNQPGSILIGMLIILNFMVAEELILNAFIAEFLFGGVQNLINVIGDIVTVYEEEKRAKPSAGK